VMRPPTIGDEGSRKSVHRKGYGEVTESLPVLGQESPAGDDHDARNRSSLSNGSALE